MVQFPTTTTTGSADVPYHFLPNSSAHPRTEVFSFHGGGIVNIPMTFTQGGITPQPITVTGRVVGANGLGLRNVVVTITDENGNVRSATTSAFGFYSFDQVLTGYGYFFKPNSRAYRFSQNWALAYVNMPPVNFTGQE